MDGIGGGGGNSCILNAVGDVVMRGEVLDAGFVSLDLGGEVDVGVEVGVVLDKRSPSNEVERCGGAKDYGGWVRGGDDAVKSG